MLSFYLRFVLPFGFINSLLFHLLTADNLSARNHCHSSWHYLSEEPLCVILATSQGGDVRWTDGYKACQTSSAQLLTLPHSNKFRSIQQKIYQLETDQRVEADYLERGAWVGKARWSVDQLCDSDRTTMEDLRWNCMILTRRSDDRSLCLKRVSCTKHHPFICESAALTEKELIESTMTRVSWWKCLINVWWCIADDQAQKQKEKEALAAQQAELKVYIDQFNFNIPQDSELEDNAIPLSQSANEALNIAGFVVPRWLMLVTGGVILFITICICCTILVCIYKMCKTKKSRRNSAHRDGSFDSNYSTVSR